MNILLIGGGGREHALAWKLAQSPTVRTIYAAPGNPGIAQHAQCVVLDVTDHAAVVAFARANTIGLVVIGPEAPLVDGLADTLRAANVATFGPSRAAAQLEGSKSFTKTLCAEHGIPTARWSAHHDAASARAAVRSFGYPVVIKADGLAAGKGVVIADDESQALASIDAMFAGAMGAAGQAVVIEEFLTGEEVSLFALTDGATVVPFGSAQDHKRIGEGDTGSNTGGMGAYSPATILTPALQGRAMAEIIHPTVAAMAALGTPFSGVLYAGLMLTADGPKLIEYNARFGDPETQVLLPRFEGDLATLLDAVATGTLADAEPPRFSNSTALTVVLAARGYPEGPHLGGAIALPVPESASTTIFQAGTRRAADALVASGGRVLAVTAVAADIASARRDAYRTIEAIDYPDGIFRRDIGWRELQRA